MNRRYDATNFGKMDFDLENLQTMLRKLRVAGHKVGLMDAVITAYAMLLREMPQLNRFIANKKLYQRNHICVSFAMLRKRSGTDVDETAVKVYIEPEDDLLAISAKIRETIQENEQPQNRNAVDKLLDTLMSAPLLPGFAVAVFKFLDKCGILPKKVINISPFHTSLFVSNLGSLQMNYVYHHLFEFGTTSLFITIGMPRRIPGRNGQMKRMMTLGVSMDERICTGAIWAKALYEFRRTLENPERLLGDRDIDEAIKPAEKEDVFRNVRKEYVSSQK